MTHRLWGIRFFAAFTSQILISLLQLSHKISKSKYRITNFRHSWIFNGIGKVTAINFMVLPSE